MNIDRKIKKKRRRGEQNNFQNYSFFRRIKIMVKRLNSQFFNSLKFLDN